MMCGRGGELEHQARNNRYKQKAVRDRMRLEWEAERMTARPGLFDRLRGLLRRPQAAVGVAMRGPYDPHTLLTDFEVSRWVEERRAHDLGQKPRHLPPCEARTSLLWVVAAPLIATAFLVANAALWWLIRAF